MKTYKEARPWGEFERFTLNEPSTVKMITVNDGEEFSLQYHKNRVEFWKILTNSGTIMIGENVFNGKKGDEYIIDHNVLHRVKGPCVFLEIATGTFDEADIVRIEDDYNRK
jgi:mannose-6-phosphate isomerase-like protein (cupin superfamily)